MANAIFLPNKIIPPPCAQGLDFMLKHVSFVTETAILATNLRIIIET